ncbi:MAG: hypothetical protein IT435_10450 [Phycisphaerales bacterium]|nr:hypothetical protein [Phycisphaerales bacterium]
MPSRRLSSPRHPPDRGSAPDAARLIALAKRITDATGDPVVGGVAVILHGGGRHTQDIDIYSTDFWATHEKLEAAGFTWDSKHREHIIDDIAVHMVPEESLGGPPKRISTIKGVKVISLADLIRGKLTVGLEEIRRSKDIAHVIDLITRIPLKKDFAAKLPKSLRAPFKELVGQVHEPRRTAIPPTKFHALYGASRSRSHRISDSMP